MHIANLASELYNNVKFFKKKGVIDFTRIERLNEIEKLSRKELYELICEEHAAFYWEHHLLAEYDRFDLGKDRSAKDYRIEARESINDEIDAINDNLKNYLMYFFQINPLLFSKIKISFRRVHLLTFNRKSEAKKSKTHGHYGINFEEEVVFARPIGDLFTGRRVCNKLNVHSYLAGSSFTFSESTTQ